MILISLFTFQVFSNKLHIDPKSLPMDLSFQRTKGNGSKHVYLFCDLDCPHCIRTERLFNSINDITIHMFVFPVPSYHPDAPRKTNAIWCSEDKAKAWQAWFDNGELPNNKENCKAPLKEIEKFAHDHQIELPIIIFEDGTGFHAEDFIQATINLNQLKKLINEHSITNHEKIL